MNDSTLLLLKDKIISTDSVIKILSEKNATIRQLREKLKEIYYKYLETNKKVEASIIKDRDPLSGKYKLLEEEHRKFVNDAEVRYQKMCQQYEEALKKNSEESKVGCAKCKEEKATARRMREENLDLKRQVKNLASRENKAVPRLDLEYKILQEELERLKSEHLEEIEGLKKNFRKKYENVSVLEASETLLKEKVNRLTLDLDRTKEILIKTQEQLNQLNQQSSSKTNLCQLLEEAAIPEISKQLKVDKSSQTDSLNDFSFIQQSYDLENIINDEFNGTFSNHNDHDFCGFDKNLLNVSHKSYNKNYDKLYDILESKIIEVSLDCDKFSDNDENYNENVLETNASVLETNEWSLETNEWSLETSESLLETNELTLQKKQILETNESMLRRNRLSFETNISETSKETNTNKLEDGNINLLNNFDVSFNDIELRKCVWEMKNYRQLVSPINELDNREKTLFDSSLNKANVLKRFNSRRLAKKRRNAIINTIKKDVFNALVKRLGKLVKRVTPEEMTVNKSNLKKQKMSNGSRMKRKLQMVRWKELRERWLSTTDSEQDISKKRRLRRIHTKMNVDPDLEKEYLGCKLEYGKLCAKFQSISEFYKNLSDVEISKNDESYLSSQDSGLGKSDLELKKKKENKGKDAKSLIKNKDNLKEQVNKKSDFETHSKKIEIGSIVNDNSHLKNLEISNEEQINSTKPILEETNQNVVLETFEARDINIKPYENNDIYETPNKLSSSTAEVLINKSEENEKKIIIKPIRKTSRKADNKNNTRKLIRSEILGLIDSEQTEKDTKQNEYFKESLIDQSNISLRDSPRTEIIPKEIQNNTSDEQLDEDYQSTSRKIIRKAHKPKENLQLPKDKSKLKRNSEIVMITRLEEKIESPTKKKSKLEENQFEKELERIIGQEVSKESKQHAFKRPNRRRIEFESPMSPPPSEVLVEEDLSSPKIIPLNRYHLTKKESKDLLNRLIQFPSDSELFQEVYEKFSSQSKTVVLSAILAQIQSDHSPPDTTYTPPAPAMSNVQRTMFGLLCKLETDFPDILEDVQARLERQIFASCKLKTLQPVTRLYVAVCKLKQRLVRIRRIVCDAFFLLDNLAVPFLFAVLSAWTEVLPLEVDSKDNIIVKVLIQVINMNTCFIPGYNLLPLKKLLEAYYGYPNERWKSEDVFKEVFEKYKENPKRVEYCLLILFKHHPPKWAFEQLKTHVKPLLDDDGLKERVRFLLETILNHLGRNHPIFIREVKSWLKQ